ncbi:MAG: hypothetical protein GX138_08075 [Firmicutes bacterium]|jgi:transposase-like protein|nr:hypothetical protein [Bacillota bacterium]
MSKNNQKQVDRKWLWLFYLCLMTFMFLLFRYGLYSKIQIWPFSLSLVFLILAFLVAHLKLRCPHCQSLAVLKNLTLMETERKTICPNCSSVITYLGDKPKSLKLKKKRK